MDGKGRICKVCPPFAGERRGYVEEAAGAMADSQARVFYDGSAANMWGGDPSACFEEVYCSLSCYCMIFSSRGYAAKMWPSPERAHAIARRIRDRGDCVLPAAAGGARVPGPPATVFDEDALPADMTNSVPGRAVDIPSTSFVMESSSSATQPRFPSEAPAILRFSCA